MTSMTLAVPRTELRIGKHARWELGEIRELCPKDQRQLPSETHGATTRSLVHTRCVQSIPSSSLRMDPV